MGPGAAAWPKLTVAASESRAPTETMAVHPRNRASLEVRTHGAPLLRATLLPAQEFLHTEGLSGIVLVAAAVTAVVWANSPFLNLYQSLWHTTLGFHFSGFSLSEDLRHWVNDALMVLFFYVAGLEIKRAFVSGELADRRSAALPILAAAGGMIVPAAIYLGFNLGSPETRHGWGVPMATDIAFAVGVLALLGNRVSTQLRMFLLALAIVDDIGAVLVIAVFYTAHLHFAALLFALLFLALMGLLMRLGVQAGIPYVLLSVAFIGAVAASGVHSTIAGVVLGLLTPRRAQFTLDDFFGFLDRNPSPLDPARAKRDPCTTEAFLAKVQEIARGTEAPADRLERGFHAWTNFVVLPLFALANAGIAFEPGFLRSALQSPAAWGVLLGLLLGKPAGILLACWAGVRAGFASLPAETSWRQITGVGIVAGIGFTMSLFIADLAFRPEQIVDAAKAGTFAASILAGLTGYSLLRFSRASR